MDLLGARWGGPVVPSYAQNAEDIRLWRVFADLDEGFYVDVGAGDPVVDSVTKLFYDAGWCGINVEPGPKYALLKASRPRDISIDAAISATRGERTFWITSPDPGLSSFERTPDALLPDGFTQAPRPVKTSRLDDVLLEHANGRQIDFLKIDVEGAEREVLESFELSSVRPTVLVVEVLAPLSNTLAADDWEQVVLDAGYLRAAFDGVNRFYVPEEHADLVPALGYPISVLDRFVPHPRQSPIERELDLDPWSTSEFLEMLRDAATAREAIHELNEMKGTLSWRITRPLRSVRRMQLTQTHRRFEPLGRRRVERGRDRVIALRLSQLAPLVGMEPAIEADANAVELASDRFASALDQSSLPSNALAWLALVGIHGGYPDERAVATAARILRMDGGKALVKRLHERQPHLSATQARIPVDLEIVSGAVVVDLAQVVTSDYHTGIQRVAREAASHWSRIEPTTILAHYDSRTRCLKVLAAAEVERLDRWRDHIGESERRAASRSPVEASGKVLVPWQCHVIVPELPDRPHAERLGALATSGVCASLSVIGFDVVPIVAPETASPEVPDHFCHFLSLVKRADRLSAISKQSARDFESFRRLLAGADSPGPEVRAHPLPTSVPDLADTDIEAARSSLGLRGLPLVLVVGAHDPRKNHVAVLEAAERLWRDGCVFELLFIGGGGWATQEFDRYLTQLASVGWPVSLRRRATERELWAAYVLARFSMFPSLLEGFGLPIAESLAVGTPVITSHHGSMAELAEDGGALLVDPRDIGAIADQMRRLLTDDRLLESLQAEARARDFGSWEVYARDVLTFFVESGS
jgi:FkbM family methyltransferase